jgi:hypothetical protein
MVHDGREVRRYTQRGKTQGCARLFITLGVAPMLAIGVGASSVLAERGEMT